MKFDFSSMVQRGHHFAVVDEVDSILIDEARTPLIISGPAEESTDLYYEVDRIIPRLKPGAVTRGDVKAEEREKLETTGDFIVDEKHKTVTLTESGMAKAEQMLQHRVAPDSGGLYDPVNMPLLHHIHQALRAHTIFKLDVDYMIKDGQVVIVDEFTGRLMPGRRWSDGLHQAVEAKEAVKIERENQTLATVTFQNYFRMYKKLSGMTGTAETEAPEFNKIYNLDVVAIPTNRTLRRHEYSDVVYRTAEEKYEAVVNGMIMEDDSHANGIRQLHESGQPVLVGTISIEKSEHLSGLLKKAGIPHQVLNAKQHEREAHIVAQAGRKGAVTVSTNMAGRGTDILLGGNPEAMARDYCLKNRIAIPYAAAAPVIGGDGEGGAAPNMVLFQIEGKIFQVPVEQWKPIHDQFAEQCRAEHDEVIELGGLHILGTERHEARRIDNQLRGRAGRQGDPGSSRFYLSLEDDLLRVFGGERVKALMYRLGMTEGVPIESKLITRRIENAQKAVEAQNFQARKHLLEYDDVMNKQRETIYSIRRSALEGKDQKDYALGIAEDLAREQVEAFCPRDEHPQKWNVTQLAAEVLNQFGIDLKAAGIDPTQLSHDELAEALVEKIKQRYEEKEALFGAAAMRWLERRILLDIVDSQWKDHLYSLDHLKEGIGLRGYGQKDPLVEFKKEAFILFEEMMTRIDNETTRYLFLVQPAKPEDQTREIERRQQRQQQQLQYQTGPAQAEAPKPVRTGAKIGRNDPCPCGSGKKYKKCCGQAA
jgi:preprotein translocase subunit SecA